jgi:[ribosomal protein S5]-alanine N-acetyltransferase
MQCTFSAFKKISFFMLEPEKLDYFKWQIPDGSRVRLTLLQEDDLEFLHKWKSQVDISYITSKPIEHISLEERQRRFKEKIPSGACNSPNYR